MVVRVELPSEELIDCWAFAALIAEAEAPDMDGSAAGLDCIVGKRPVAPLIPGLEGLKFVARDLDDADRQYLARVLPDLPELKLPISEEEAGTFMEAFRHRADRQSWEPVLITERYYLDKQHEIFQRRRRHAELHREALQQLIVQGDLDVVIDGNVPVVELVIGSMMLREDAKAYLVLCRVDFGEERNPTALERLAEATNRSIGSSLMGNPLDGEVLGAGDASDGDAASTALQRRKPLSQWTKTEIKQLHSEYLKGRAIDVARKAGLQVSELYLLIKDLPKKSNAGRRPTRAVSTGALWPSRKA